MFDPTRQCCARNPDVGSSSRGYWPALTHKSNFTDSHAASTKLSTSIEHMASLLAERIKYMLHAVAEENRTSQVKECKVPPLASRSPAEANPLDATQRQFVSPQASIDTPLLGRACPAASAPRGPSGMTPQQERIDSALREGPYGEVNCMPSNSTVKRSPLNRVVNCGTVESHPSTPNEPAGKVQPVQARMDQSNCMLPGKLRLRSDIACMGVACYWTNPIRVLRYHIVSRMAIRYQAPPPCHPEGRHGLGPRI